jgi:hypothetical protein
MVQIADTHCLGLLVIDEIQNLSTVKSGGAEQMLNFFLKLVDTIKIPVLRIGTNKAMAILRKDMRHGRRGTGEGAVYWDRLKRDTDENKATWEFFVKGFFDYQWTKKPVPYTDEIDDVLYDESQGIADIAIKLFMLAQWRAIALGTETITAPLIKQVADDSLGLVSPMLKALRSGNPDLIMQYSDIEPLDIDEFYDNYREKVELKQQEKLKKAMASVPQTEDASALLSQLIIELLKLNIPPHIAKFCAEAVFAKQEADSPFANLIKDAYEMALTSNEASLKKTPPAKDKAAVKKAKATSLLPDDLRLVVAEAKKSKMAAYDAIKNQGEIKSPLQDILLNSIAC